MSSPHQLGYATKEPKGSCRASSPSEPTVHIWPRLPRCITWNAMSEPSLEKLGSVLRSRVSWVSWKGSPELELDGFTEYRLSRVFITLKANCPSRPTLARYCTTPGE